jgi:outer membrane protein
MSIKAVLVLAAAGLISVGAAGVASGAELKIGFVDLDKVLEQSPQLEAARNALQTEFSRRQQDLLDKQKQLEQLEEKLTRNSAVMGSNERDRLERDIISRRRTLKNELTAAQEDLNLRQSEEFNKLRRQVLEIVRNVSKGEQMDLVVSTGVVYSSKRIDLTDEVLERLRKEPAKR